ncbi:TPA: AraC family transcriptional regulator [Pasteurella multocida]|uniref:AraC family transcriptional regulator n=1 Tax=Pasteurella multocida TaxID=747 RepID=UPI00061A7CE4|nr:AraC family transcriptional regulator [Pasteurella multocida]AKD39742.1 AraC family transcriptional regulator [Pasteurella multocida OH1905]URJ92039.1 AraC family transcriptional regulator [Pasteurella multocida]WRK06025.1 AraC family transcriptional regulator [Pasteurella multocida]HDR1787700.1 AraC family transcriptional regulator [Pasteurella multocida]HDR1906645.1 AraC family transcriptional regulator [Pasteurella multocida]
MNIIKSFNNTIDYLETVLDGEISEKKVTQLSGYSYSMFSRLFSILIETTLSEYLRSRRLTEAAVILRDTDEKIIDVAFKFGYESSDSFGTAFKNFHGFTPSEVRNGKPFKLVSRVQLALSVRGGRSMNITIQKKKAFTVAGVNEENINSSLCTCIWQKLFSKVSHEEMSKLGTGESVGVCHDILNLNNHDVLDTNTINYMAGYIVNDAVQARSMGLDVLEVEEAEYAIVELTGSVPECIHNGWKYAMEVFFPEHGYVHSGKPDFEYYYEGDMNSKDYKMELWIPICKS